jgi:hypothetical protein
MLFTYVLLTCVCSEAPEQETRNEGRTDLTARRRIEVLCFVTGVFAFDSGEIRF